ncbi:MAG: hypothetical protein DWI25_09750 [Planctomycetota bacterium]|nr:MAG: hypothetical protein DWI25_09750 [Planctomycetota bacterium]
MSVIRVGTTSQYASGWDQAFSGGRSSRRAGKSASDPTPKAVPPKAAAKKGPAKKKKSAAKQVASTKK